MGPHANSVAAYAIKDRESPPVTGSDGRYRNEIRVPELTAIYFHQILGATVRRYHRKQFDEEKYSASMPSHELFIFFRQLDVQFTFYALDICLRCQPRIEELKSFGKRPADSSCMRVPHEDLELFELHGKPFSSLRYDDQLGQLSNHVAGS